MKNILHTKMLGAWMLMCVSMTWVQAQVYRHTFDNLSAAPAQSELDTPNTIDPNMTSQWDASGGNLGTFSYNGNKGLSNKGNNHSYTLTLKLAPCQQLEITSIQLFRLSGDGASFQLMINGSNYGDSFGSSLSRQNVTQTATVSGLTGEITIAIQITNSQDFSKYYTSIDDFTIHGSVTATAVPLGAVSFEAGASSSRCQAFKTETYTATGAHARSLTYSLDGSSIAAGITINAATGEVSYPSEFFGTTVVTAKATGCSDETAQAVHTITTEPFVPVVDMDFALLFNEFGEGIASPQCSSFGTIYSEALAGTAMDVKVRFKNGVRYFEFKPEPGHENAVSRLTLYYTQSDFDNYSGSAPLPQYDGDEAGMANLRLWVYHEGSDQNGAPDEIITPEGPWSFYFDPWTRTWSLYVDMNGFSTIILKDVNSPLPVKLSSFSAENRIDGNRLSWNTTEETHFSHFELERSADPRNGFATIATVMSKGNASGESYGYLDQHPSAGRNFYRLKMVDTDGSFEYSRIVTTTETGEPLLVYPNPARENLTIESPGGVTHLQLVDAAGREILRRDLVTSQEAIQLALPSGARGEHLLRVTTATGQEIRKIVIH